MRTSSDAAVLRRRHLSVRPRAMGARMLGGRLRGACDPARVTAHPRLGVATFVRDDGGYTTVAMAVALLVSLTLVLSLASAEWLSARSGDVQPVADASALAGANAVASFSTVAQVTDACVLSLGLAGLATMGAGLVIACVPVLQAKAPAVIDAGRNILDARRDFSRSACEGLQSLERALPALVMANSASCVSANCAGGIGYLGCAVPFPQESETDYGNFEDALDATEVERRAERLREASARKEEAMRRASAAKERAWRADCVDAPMCLRSRAAKLAGLSGANNPDYPLASEWRFGYAKARATNYYLVRSRQEAPGSQSPLELSRSCARHEFYRFAYAEISAARCVESAEAVSIELPELPHNRDTTRQTRLYTDAVWPCTYEPEGVVMHSTLGCPAARGTPVATISLAMFDNGLARRCATCEMDLATMAGVADASTNIDNGFEHYWRIVVEASREYQAAREEAAAADDEMRAAADDGLSAFQRALRELGTRRPTYRPAGAWGCVSLVVRKEGISTPSELSSAFVSGTELPGGAALAAATLAPDDADDGSTVLGSLLDGVRSRATSPALDLVGNVCELWGRMLEAYGSGYESVSDAAGRVFDGIGSLFGEKVASWLKGRLEDAVAALGIAPADLRARKPVLVRSRQVLEQAGAREASAVVELSDQLARDPRELAREALGRLAGELGLGSVTIAELPVPGLEGVSIPLTIDVATLVGAS